jgi:CheY-like chemotaxis protein
MKRTAKAMNPVPVLLVDDDIEPCASLARLLGMEGFAATAVHDAEAAVYEALGNQRELIGTAPLSPVSGTAFRPFVFLCRGNVSQPANRNRLLVRKLGHKSQAASDSFHVISQRGEQQVTSLLQTRDPILAHIEGAGHGLLGFVDRVPEFPQRHFPRDQLAGAGLDLFPPLRADLLQFLF